jgi:hypothetical protein
VELKIMAKKAVAAQKTAAAGQLLEGWQKIAHFLGEPVSVVQRWAAEGMPLRREGRYVVTTADELNAWLARDTGTPVHVVTPDSDLSAELKRGLEFVRREAPAKKKAKPKRS